MSTPHADAQLAAVDEPTAPRRYDTPLGITNPPIDELLDRASSKYALVIYAAKRARQINDYYNQLGDGILEYVGPLVEPGLQEKPLSIAMREIHGDLLEHTEGGAEGTERRRTRADRKRIIVGVAGGIAAYKACTVVRQLDRGRPLGSGRFRPSPRCGSSVPPPSRRCRATPSTPASSRTSTRCRTSGIGQEADLVVVAPATADLLARAVAGRADDLLTATLLTARCPVLFAPAMHTEMWLHPATVDNVATLRAPRRRRARAGVRTAHRRRHRRGPAARGRGDHHAGQLLLDRGDALPYDLAGVKVLVTAGGTREPLDPVRFIGNRSSGKQGYAVARVAAQRGADVTLIAGNTAGLIDPAGVDVVHIGSAAQLRTRCPSTRPTPTCW